MAETPYVPRFKARYRDELVPALKDELGFTNVMQVPRVEKIVVNMGVGDAIKDGRMLDAALEDLTTITGQKPVVTKARKSIAGFQASRGDVDRREGDPSRRSDVGSSSTVLVSLALPRIRDFRGLDPGSFDGHGNYTFGVTEQLDLPGGGLRQGAEGPRDGHHHRHHRAERRRRAGVARGVRIPVRR